MNSYGDKLAELEIKARMMIHDSKKILDDYRAAAKNKFDAELAIKRNLPALYELSQIKEGNDG